MRHNIEIPAKLHNRFIIEVFNTETLRKKTYYAYNLITNTGMESYYGFLPNRSSKSSPSTYERYIRKTGNATSQIGIGSGTGTLSPARTSLFNVLLRKDTAYYARSIDNSTQTASYTQYITILPEELVGQTLTEVGLYIYYNGKYYLLTHALIVDAEGNPISIPKTANDQITIYYQVFMQLTNNIGNNFILINNNALLSLLYNNGVIYYFSPGVGLGNSSEAPQPTDPYIKSPKYEKQQCTWTRDVTNRKLTIGTRFGTTEANGQKIWEIGMQWYLTTCQFGTKGWYPLFRSVIPVGNWTGHTIEEEQVGTGDGSTTQFMLKWAPINAGSAHIYVDGVELVPDAEYTIDETAGQITFITAPAQDKVITATYSVLFIPKDDQHVLDVYVDINFADAGV